MINMATSDLPTTMIDDGQDLQWPANALWIEGMPTEMKRTERRPGTKRLLALVAQVGLTHGDSREERPKSE
jgi:hypothetical protein